jgi:hypothetical protein
MKKEEIAKLDMYDLIHRLRAVASGERFNLAWDELESRIGNLMDEKRISIIRATLGSLTNDEIKSLRHYLVDSYCNDNGTVYCSVGSEAIAKNEMALKAMEVRRKILEAR